MAPVGDGIPVKPLIAHGTDNGCPSDHGLLAALIVAAVLLLGIRYIAPLVVLGVLVDWARVGAGLHHLLDIVGGAAFVALGLAIGHAVGPTLSAFVIERIPERFLDRRADKDEIGAGTSLPGRGGTGHAYAEMAQHSGDCARNCLVEGRLEPG